MTTALIPLAVAHLCKVLRVGTISATSPEGAAVMAPFVIVERAAYPGGPRDCVMGYVRLDGATQAHVNTVKWYGGASRACGHTFGTIANSGAVDPAAATMDTLTGWVTCRFPGALA